VFAFCHGVWREKKPEKLLAVLAPENFPPFDLAENER
jgi:hypothetical protein